jgi:hypothetical protein
MPNFSERTGHEARTRCAVCNGKFGLVRHYVWRTPLCTRACVDRFRCRRENDRVWLSWVRIGLQESPEHSARAL